MLNYPENLRLEQLTNNNEHRLSLETNLYYDHNEILTEEAKTSSSSSNSNSSSSTTKKIWLERVKVVDLNSIDSVGSSHFQLSAAVAKEINAKKKLVITQTNCQTILEAVLVDAFQSSGVVAATSASSSSRKSNVFQLDYRLVPYKACVLFESNAATPTTPSTTKTNAKFIMNANSLSTLADKIRHMLYLNQINSFVMEAAAAAATAKNDDSDDDHECKENYILSDELGIPFSIYLPLNAARDGICYVRNRDTMLSEQIHISKLVNKLNSTFSSLNF
jgi:glycyl-tRNA synthetase (class II)